MTSDDDQRSRDYARFVSMALVSLTSRLYALEELVKQEHPEMLMGLDDLVALRHAQFVRRATDHLGALEAEMFGERRFFPE